MLMTTQFLFQGLDIDERTREYVSKRLRRVEKLVDPASKIEIEIDRDKKGKFRVEVMVRAPKKQYRAEETTGSVEASTDLVIDELERQVAKEKDRHDALSRRGGRSIKKKMTLDADSRF